MALEIDQAEEPKNIQGAKPAPVANDDGFDDSAVVHATQPDAYTDLSEIDSRRQKALNDMFPVQEQFHQYTDAFVKMVDPAEQELYTDTLIQYAKGELDDRKTMSVTTRLEHFENSPEFKATPLKVKLSDHLKKAHASELNEALREERKSASLGGPEAPNGLSRGEGNASVNAQNNLVKSAENLGAMGTSMAGGVSSLMGGALKVVTAPFELAHRAAVEHRNKVRGDNIPRQEQILQEAIDLNLKTQATAVEKIFNLPKNTPKSELQPMIEDVEKRDKELAGQIRTQSRQGVTNLLDDNLTDKQKLSIKTEEEVLDSGEGNSKKRSSLLDKLASSPALEGEGKEQLKEKAKAMAAEAAEMIRKMIESIRNMFTQGHQVKAAGSAPEAPAAGRAPRM